MYETKYKIAQDAADARRAETQARIPGLAEIDLLISSVGMRIMAEALGAGENCADKIAQIRSDTEKLRAQKEQMLVAAGYPADYTDVKYECEKCSDSGFVDGYMCECMKRELVMAGYESSGIANLLRTQSFDTFSLDYYKNNPEAYRLMSLNFEYLKSYAENFRGRGSENILLMGGTGLGKTHLLYAITDRLKKNFPHYKVVYVKGEEFTIQLIDAISRNLNAEFREKYRSADVLLIDDIQFIAGREATQEEFFHTFNTLYENGKQIILASDVPPRDIKLLEERLRTRFECGVLADINAPDIELRTAIIKKKVQNLGATFPDEVMDYIAENLTSNVRQLEGVVKRISAQCLLTGEPVSLDLAVRCISDQMVGSEPVSVTIDKILSSVSAHYRLTVEDLKSRKRTSNIAFARHVSIYLIKKFTDRSLPAIGRVFSRDHTTIINSIETVEKKLASDPSFENEIQELMREIKKR
jgi:chromosomal replication initiator protein DnaA